MPSSVTSSEDVTRSQALAFEEQYVRRDIIGHGAFKTVYRAYDSDEGIEVAWNQVRLQGVKPEQKAKILGEITILEQLETDYIMRILNSWESSNGEYLIFITEIMSSGTLKDYVRDASRIKLKTIKKWCTQILHGLDYLHSHQPPIIHRDLKCDNIFIHGSRGEVKIGDLGLSICMKDKKFASSVIGTPEFMAPELYEEKYDSKVDIYAFGMCVLELVTGDYPYSECENAAQVYKKVSNGIQPHGINSIKHQPTRDFIFSCIAEDPDKRPSARELLNHPWMLSKEHDDLIFVLTEESPHDTSAGIMEHTSRAATIMHDADDTNSTTSDLSLSLDPSHNKPTSLPGEFNLGTFEVVEHAGDLSPTLSLPSKPEDRESIFVLQDHDAQETATSSAVDHGDAITSPQEQDQDQQESKTEHDNDEDEEDDDDLEFTIPRVVLDSRLKSAGTEVEEAMEEEAEEEKEEEQRHQIVGMRLYLKIHGNLKEIKFPFNLQDDTPEDVASEMMSELDLSKADCQHIARGIRKLLSEYNLVAKRLSDPDARHVMPSSSSSVAIKTESEDDTQESARETMEVSDQPHTQQQEDHQNEQEEEEEHSQISSKQSAEEPSSLPTASESMRLETDVHPISDQISTAAPSSSSSPASTPHEGGNLLSPADEEGPVTRRDQAVSSSQELEHTPQAITAEAQSLQKDSSQAQQLPNTEAQVERQDEHHRTTHVDQRQQSKTDAVYVDDHKKSTNYASQSEQQAHANVIRQSRIISNQATTVARLHEARRPIHSALRINTLPPTGSRTQKDTNSQRQIKQQQQYPSTTGVKLRSRSPSPSMRTGRPSRTSSTGHDIAHDGSMRSIARQFAELSQRHRKEEKDLVLKLREKHRKELEQFQIEHNLSRDTLDNFKIKYEEERIREFESRQQQRSGRSTSSSTGYRHSSGSSMSNNGSRSPPAGPNNGNGSTSSTPKDGPVQPPSPRRTNVSSGVFNGRDGDNGGNGSSTDPSGGSIPGRSATPSRRMSAAVPLMKKTPTSTGNNPFPSSPNMKSSTATTPNLSRKNSSSSTSSSSQRNSLRTSDSENDGLASMISKNLDSLGSFSLSTSNSSSTNVSPTEIDRSQPTSKQHSPQNRIAKVPLSQQQQHGTQQSQLSPSYPNLTNLISKTIPASAVRSSQEFVNLEVRMANEQANNVDNLLGEEVVVHGNSFVVENIEKKANDDDASLLSFDIVRSSTSTPTPINSSSDPNKRSNADT